jgi:non-specific serine/threonine protein kinase
MLRLLVPQIPSDKSPRGPLQVLSDWLRGSSTPRPVADATVDLARVQPPSRIAHYEITGTLGRGGMGVVYSARDERLGRSVALKMMSSLKGDPTARERFWREARAAASVSHPNICQLYEIGEAGGELFIAMERLEGRSLADRLHDGPLAVGEMMPAALGMLSALGALHARGIIHRDLKPSNVFLTPHGVKLLDFGLARPSGAESAFAPAAAANLTRTGMILGTPRYMSPEQVNGGTLDPRSDLFAAGAIFFEMLAGRPAFAGDNVIEVLHATLHEQPPALSGSPAVAAADRVLRRALAKDPADRPASADAMADDLRGVRVETGADPPAVASALTRLVVLPFRVLRPDPETDFLAYSLPDAIATSLARFGSIVVRSSATAARFAGESPDFKTLAAEADVDRVVTGTVLRSGDQLQATAQLVEAPRGTLLSSHSVLSSLGNLFQLQDDIARRVVEALALPLGGGPASPTPEAPLDARAYELYLRANELSRRYERMAEARDLYQRCLDLDPNYAPAWAQLGRCQRVIGKYIDDSEDTALLAEEAFRRALQLDPRLSLAHKFYAAFEADTGQTISALRRLLNQASRHGNDPELFAGLVHACRYCGLLDQSIAAHREARRLDPNVPTSVEQTVQMTCDFDRLLGVAGAHGVTGGDDVIRIIARGLMGRRDEARAALVDLRASVRVAAFQTWSEFLLAWLDRRPDRMATIRESLEGLRIMDDPEAIFQGGWLQCDAGDFERGLALVRRSIERGYFVAPTLAVAPQFAALRDRPEFREVLAMAEAGRDRAFAVFREGGGERLLGG